ncbi:MAG: HEAT repeat domain-containing protein [Thermomicrobiaceae bacterium]
MSFTTSQEPTPDPPINLQELLQEFASGNVDPARVAEISDPSREQIQDMRNSWNTLPVETRRELLREMRRQSEENLALEFTRYFRLAMGDKDDEVRAIGIRALWEDDTPSFLDNLAALAEIEESPAVQEAIALSLGTFSYMVELDELDPEPAAKTQRALFHLIENGGNWMVRRRALESAAYMSRNQRVRTEIQRAYESDFEQECAGALVAMGRNLNPDWFPIILQELTNEDPDIRCEAARAAGEFGDPVAIDQLSKMIDDEDEEVREVSVRSIGQIGDKKAIDTLRYLDTQVPEELKPTIEVALEEARFLSESTGLEE